MSWSVTLPRFTDAHLFKSARWYASEHVPSAAERQLILWWKAINHEADGMADEGNPRRTRYRQDFCGAVQSAAGYRRAGGQGKPPLSNASSAMARRPHNSAQRNARR